MEPLAQMRRHAEDIARAGIAGVDPAPLVAGCLARRGGSLFVEAGGMTRSVGSSLRLVAAGKAACPMAAATVAELPPGLLEEGLVVTTHESVESVPGCEVVGAGHPLPDQAGADAAARVAELAAAAGPGDTLLVLLSGGSSALLASPVEGVSLDDLTATTKALLAGGASIGELNCVRKHLSALAGGGLVRLASPATVVALVLSDVVGDDPAVIGSGPTVPDPSTAREALSVLDRRAGGAPLPGSVRQVLEDMVAGVRPETPGPGDPVFDRAHTAVIGGNSDALAAAARRAGELGYPTRVVDGALTGEARLAGARIADDMSTAAGEQPVCLLYGGETTVTVVGDGVGGRNQELALAAALHAEGWAGAPDWVVAAVGTDGRDGPTDAAGGVVDRATASRIREAGGDPVGLLARNDSHRALGMSGDLVVTGPTGTNVADLVVALVGGPFHP